jgi:predicted small metal-binding protein
VRHEVRDEQPPLTARQRSLEPPPLPLDDEPTAELHLRRRQLGANIEPNPKAYNDAVERRRGMAKQISCECGYVVRGDTDPEVMQGARDHMRADHPDLLEKVSDDDLRGWIEEV